MERKEIVKNAADQLRELALGQPDDELAESFSNYLMAVADLMEVLA